MRGQVSSKFCISRILGITPADAGTRQTLGIGVIGGEDHPRGCGDKFLSVAEKRLNLGSPPRMRGQVVVLSASDGVMRITPADAGTSMSIPPVINRLRDHPRGCGDKSK